MTLISLPGGMLWPYNRHQTPSNGTSAVLNVTGRKLAMMGRLFIQGRAASKTIDTSGSSTIWFNIASASTLASTDTVFEVKFETLDTGGPPPRSSGTQIGTAKSVITTATNTTPALSSASGMTPIVPTVGTTTLNHGDLISIVAEAVTIGTITPGDNFEIGSLTGGTTGMPTTNAFIGGAWGGTGVSQCPCAVIVFSDGTLGWFDNAVSVSNSQSMTAYNSGSSPDERGLIFQVPFDCKIDALWGQPVRIQTTDGTSDFEMSLWEFPEGVGGTITELATTGIVDSTQYGPATTEAFALFTLTSEITLTRNKDYCVSFRANEAGDIRSMNLNLGHESHRAFYPGGTTMRTVTRTDNTGNFGSSTTTILHCFGVRISSVHDTASSGGGSQRIIGQ